MEKREIKFKFIIKADEKTTIVTGTYTIDDLLDNVDTEFILENIEPECNSSGCYTETQNFCDCGLVYESAKIIHKIQYIGLNDEEDKEIFEGDIIEASILKPVGGYGKTIDLPAGGLIEYVRGQFCINIGKTKAGDTRYRYFNQLWPHSQNKIQCKIVGNKYENPELLENA